MTLPCILMHAHLRAHAGTQSHLYTHHVLRAFPFFFLPYIDWDSAEQWACAGWAIAASRWCSPDTSQCAVLQLRAPAALNPNRVWQSHYLLVLCCLSAVAPPKNRALNGKVVLWASWHAEVQYTPQPYLLNYRSVVRYRCRYRVQLTEVVHWMHRAPLMHFSLRHTTRACNFLLFNFIFHGWEMWSLFLTFFEKVKPRFFLWNCEKSWCPEHALIFSSFIPNKNIEFFPV